MSTSMDGSDDSYEVIDYSENPMFLILSAVFEDDKGNGICDYLARLTKAIERNTAAIERSRSKRKAKREHVPQ